MYRFEHTMYLYALVLMVPLAMAFWGYWRWRKQSKLRLGELSLVDRLMPQQTHRKHITKFVLISLAFVLLVVSFANPQMGIHYEKASREGIEIAIALDISNSMLAQDVKPTRLDKAKHIVHQLLGNLSNDKVGLIVFAGTAYPIVPLTLDYGAVEMMLDNVEPSFASMQGTVISDAVAESLRMFNSKNAKHQVLLLITDGEDHDDVAVKIVQTAAKAGIVVHAIGLGTKEGSTIPQAALQEPKRDKAGKIIISKIDENLLKEIAKAGNGNYYDEDMDITMLVDELNKMDKQALEQRITRQYESQFQYFLILALILLTLEFLILERKTTWTFVNKLFG
ncbi:MAG: VWA domain-containing protein [Chitinophagales bacterium]|nr:VWA domain-containing protein [Chitinophagales bacterium]